MSAPISNGVYRLSAVTGALGAVAAGSDVFAWRYAPATPGAATYAVLEYLAVSAIVSATITASVLFDLAAYAARLWTVADTGGTAIPFTLNQQKANSAFGTPGIADARISATAALTAGTYTRDSNPFARIQGVTGTVLGTYVFGGGAASLGAGKVDLWVPGVTPFQMSFAPNEGIVIQNPLIGPATGSITLLIEMGWTEVAAN